MKKIVVLAAFFLLVATTMAAADVSVTGNVSKDKDVTVTEDVTITKDVYIDVDLLVEAEKAAEAESFLNQDQTDNFACENCAEKTAEVVGSIVGNSGLVNLNQATGNMANQSNAISFALDTGNGNGNGNGNGEEPAPAYGFAHAQTGAEQVMVGNEIDTVNVIYRDALITDSINGNTGIVFVNQAVGNISNQANILTVGVSLNGLVALAEADLGQQNASNLFTEHDTEKTALIGGPEPGGGGSINGNTGVVGVNQSAGTLGNQLNAVNVSAAIY